MRVSSTLFRADQERRAPSALRDWGHTQNRHGSDSHAVSKFVCPICQIYRPHSGDVSIKCSNVN
jgi:hypothetical protein